ncbi:MAG: hypothetical protein A2902_06035 [Elusimicrobia bacterium RIFCSPLOWO2_01_FULL_64_13]|nr:MAG: hypothetical protein A2902_06035 [Elusimicrobia bacterium RIFCSPLOWO2_01_FULL_64_13]
MFLNYVAGVSSLVLAVSAFIPWVTVWFYSRKGIESAYGIGIFLVGVLGLTLAVFQHFSGKMRGRSFIGYSLIALVCEGFYFKKMAEIGTKLNEIAGYLTDIFGDKIMAKAQALLGEQWTAVMIKLLKRSGIDTTVSGVDFIGGGLVLAVASSLVLLIVGILLEKNKTSIE